VSADDAARLEALWAGEFGAEYTERNRAAGERREPFWRALLAERPCASVLEVGCNLGGNLGWIASLLPGRLVVGIDVNRHALGRLRQTAPGARGVAASALHLPFADGSFDLVATVGVLIHQPPARVADAMREAARCARRYVLCAEYYADALTEVEYRGQPGSLFKRDFGALYREVIPSLRLGASGFLSRAEGWGDVTYWVFEK
jgi:pseudaminic acid biosynthesis-associated methylase